MQLITNQWSTQTSRTKEARTQKQVHVALQQCKTTHCNFLSRMRCEKKNGNIPSSALQDLAPGHFWLIPRLKAALRGQTFERIKKLGSAAGF